MKFSPPEYPHLVENEVWFLASSETAGLRTPRHQLIIDRSGATALVIERFDRAVRTKTPALCRGRRHAGARSLPGRKHRLTSEQVTHALIDSCQAPVVAASEVFRMFLFAWLTGNGDMHAKNISMINEGRVADRPHYDVPSTLPYGDDSMALPLPVATATSLGRLSSSSPRTSTCPSKLPHGYRVDAHRDRTGHRTFHTAQRTVHATRATPMYSPLFATGVDSSAVNCHPATCTVEIASGAIPPTDLGLRLWCAIG